MNSLCVILQSSWLYRKLHDIIFHDYWMVGWIDQPIQNAVDWKNCPQVNWLNCVDPAHYIADPMAMPDHPNMILVENFNFASGIGTLRALTIDGINICEDTPIDLPVKGHLSYPFTFKHCGDIYMMPESSNAGYLAILRWEKEKKVWMEFCRPLPDTPAADATLFEHDGQFWVAYTDSNLGHFDNLNICFAPDLAGPWQKHPQNPIRRDWQTTRCGGTVFSSNCKLYRPVQDCLTTYGASIRIMEITECTPTRYAEKEVNNIPPEIGLHSFGLHTLSAWGDRCLVDGKHYFLSWKLSRQKLARYFNRAVKKVID